MRLYESVSVPTRGLSEMLGALTGGNQDDENKSKIHVTDEVQMHRLAASAAAGSSSTLCLPGLPSASVATNFAQDQQNTWKMLMDMQQQMISFQTGLMHALETATVAATAARVQQTQLKDLEDRQDRLNPHRCQTSDLAREQTGSIQSKSCTMRRSSTLNSKPCSMTEMYKSL